MCLQRTCLQRTCLQLGGRVLGGRVLGGRVLGGRALGGRVLGGRVLAGRVLGGRMLGGCTSKEPKGNSGRHYTKAWASKSESVLLAIPGCTNVRQAARLLAKVKPKLAKRKGELAKAKPKLAKRKGELKSKAQAGKAKG